MHGQLITNIVNNTMLKSFLTTLGLVSFWTYCIIIVISYTALEICFPDHRNRLPYSTLLSVLFRSLCNQSQLFDTKLSGHPFSIVNVQKQLKKKSEAPRLYNGFPWPFAIYRSRREWDCRCWYTAKWDGCKRRESRGRIALKQTIGHLLAWLYWGLRVISWNHADASGFTQLTSQLCYAWSAWMTVQAVSR